MDNFLTTVISMFIITFFTSCANMEIGFEEDSIFYTKPTSKEQKTETETQEPKTLQTTAVVEKKTEEKEKMQEEVENETTFYYDREDGE